MLNDFTKHLQLELFFMPLWTEAELEVVAPLFTTANDWRHRFEILGGIPRKVLEYTDVSPTEMLKEACYNCSLYDCITQIGMHSTITEQTTVYHYLVYMTSVPPFTNSLVCYASPTALNAIIRYKGFDAKIFWILAHAIELLERGGTFSCRRLEHGDKRNKPAETTLDIPASDKIVVEEVSSKQTTNQLYVPSSANSAVVDAWIPGIGAFQVTFGKMHEIKDGIHKDLSMLGGAKRLYWLLQPLHYHSFIKKVPDDIEQYSLKIPYPE